jgi:hypothetical protein
MEKMENIDGKAAEQLSKGDEGATGAQVLEGAFGCWVLSRMAIICWHRDHLLASLPYALLAVITPGKHDAGP